MPDPIRTVLDDPGFKKLAPQDRQRVIDRVLAKDPEFRGMGPKYKDKVKSKLYGEYVYPKMTDVGADLGVGHYNPPQRMTTDVASDLGLTHSPKPSKAAISTGRRDLGIPSSVNLHKTPIDVAHSKAEKQHQIEHAKQIAQAVVQQQQIAKKEHMGEVGLGPSGPAPSPAAIQQYNKAGSVLEQEQQRLGSFWNRVQPGFDDVIRNTQGLRGALQKGAAGVSDPQNLALIGAMAFAGPELAPLAGHAFTLDMARGFAQSAMDTEKLESDPRGYYGDLIFQGALMGLSHAAPHLWAKIKETSEARIGQKQTYAIINELKSKHEELFAREKGPRGFKVTEKGELKKKEVKTDAVQKQSAAQGLPRKERSKVELQGVGEGNKEQKPAGARPAKEEVKTTPKARVPRQPEPKPGSAPGPAAKAAEAPKETFGSVGGKPTHTLEIRGEKIPVKVTEKPGDGTFGFVDENGRYGFSAEEKFTEHVVPDTGRSEQGGVRSERPANVKTKLPNGPGRSSRPQGATEGPAASVQPNKVQGAKPTAQIDNLPSLTGETSRPAHVNRIVFRTSIDKLKALGHSHEDIEALEGGYTIYNQARTPAEIKAASLALRDELQKTAAKTPVKVPDRPAQAAKPVTGTNVPAQAKTRSTGQPRSKTRGSVNFGYAEGSPADRFYKSVREAARRISQQGDDWTTFAKLYDHMKKEDPRLTREEFAQSIKDLEKVPGVHLEGPTGPKPKPEDVFGGHFAVWFEDKHEDIAPDYQGMSKQLQELHDHPYRKIDGNQSDASLKNFMGRLEYYAKTNHPEVMGYIDDAWGYFGKGQTGKATDAFEHALTIMHSKESAAFKSTKTAATRSGRSRSGKITFGHAPVSPAASVRSAVQSLVNRVKPYVPISKSGGRYHATAVIDPETADLIHTASNTDSYGEQLGSKAFRTVTAGLTPQETADFVRFMQSNNLELDNPSHPYVLPKKEMERIWGKPGKRLTPSQARIQAAALEHHSLQNELYSLVLKGSKVPEKTGFKYSGPTGENLFMNMIPKKDALGNPVMVNARPGAASRSPKRQMTINPSRAALRRAGTGVEYETDLEKIYQAAYKNALPGAIKYDIYSGMVAKGIAKKLKMGERPPATIKYRGVEYPATTETYKIGKKPGEIGKIDRQIVLPSQIHADIKDATGSKPFAKRTYIDPNALGGPKEMSSTPGKDLEQALTDVQLASPKVITGHSLRVITMVTKMIDPSLPGVRKAIDTLFNAPTLGVVPRLTKLHDLANLDPVSTSEYISKEGYTYSNQSIRVDLARANAVDNRTFDNSGVIGQTPGIKQLRELGHGALFHDPKGPSELFKAKTTSELYKAMSEFGLDIRAKIMIEKVRRMVDGYDPHDPQLDDKIRKEAYKLGEYVKKPGRFVEIMKFFNKYAGTSAPMRATELKQFFGVTGRTGKNLTPAQRSVWRAQTLAMSGIGTFMGYVAWNKLLSGHMPWDNKQDNTLEFGNGWHISMSDVNPADTRAMTTLGLMRSARDLQTGEYMDIPKAVVKGGIGAATDLAVGPGIRILGTATGQSFYVIDPRGNAILAKPYPGAQYPLPDSLYDGDSSKDTYVKRFRAVLGEVVPAVDPVLDLFGGSSEHLSALRTPKNPPLDPSEVNPWDSLWRHVISADSLFNSALVQPDKQPKSSGALDPETQKYMRQFENIGKVPSYK